MRFIDYKVFIRDIRFPLVTPIVRRIDDYALGIACALFLVSARNGAVAVPARAPSIESCHSGARSIACAYGSSSNLAGLKRARGRIVRPNHAIAVALPRTDSRKVRMPHVLSSLDQRYSRDFVVSMLAAKQAKRRASRMFGEQREVRAGAVKGCAERISRARRYF